MSHLGLWRVSGETICTMESTSSTTCLIRRSRRHSHLYLELLRSAPSRLPRSAPLMRLSVSLPFQYRLGSALSPHNATFGYRAYRIHTKKGGGIEAVSTMEESELKKGVAEFYDESSSVMEGIWGDHLHHGIYFVDDPSHQEEQKAFASLPRAAQIRTIQAAQMRTIDEALRFAAVSDDGSRRPKQIVDVGCGIGGSSTYLAKKYGAICHGITLSPIQAQRAQAHAAAQGLADKVFFQVADALEQPFPDGQFDLVWSLESGEHIHDKRKFVSELARVAAPGATIIIVTWCHRDLSPSEESLKPEEKKLLKKICDAYYLNMCSAADYVQLLESLSLQDIKAADWSEYVTPFWGAVVRTLLSWKAITSVIHAGWKAIKGALAVRLLIEGHKKGLMKFAIITCRKPD